MQLSKKMSDLNLEESDFLIDTAICIAFVLNTMKLVDAVTPMLSLKHLHTASLIVGNSIAIIERAMRSLEEAESQLEPLQWTPSDLQERAFSGHSSVISTPPSSPLMDAPRAEQDFMSLREFLETMTAGGMFLLSTKNIG
jgi:hypothetical protein